MEMLCREGMDFNHLLRHGIRYLSRDEESEIRAMELDRAEGVREMISIDKGGEEFLSTVRFSCPLPPQLFKWGDKVDVR